ncbi:site-specific DNA-methyltransferase [Hansschlegelia zhihuaiae]|uniref:site-specific DNA-methyltransferase (adenine-specific) n=1 Tax=Hansschlegelia zhihuaiae TaxID=405005 RepID=A0A4V1KHF0_9HYPH|nr:site-specific DNA-methyltransferase [Hansschlegelia zhihuaiae]RXF66962.1 site-specific DNA-methyltransferase [Hansschlegelia zhihuaiae]
MTAAQNAQIQSTNYGAGSTDRDLAVTWRPVADLIPYARNARTHSDAQVAQIAGSIREFGWTNPILVDGRNGVVAGHGRLLAARKLQMDSVPVIELAGLTEAQRRAYVLADNKLALNAGWDEAMLAAEVADLVALGVDLDLAGFGTGEVEALLASQDGGRSFEDEAPEPPVIPVSRPGDLWLIGSHRLLCGDATRQDDVRKALGGALADMVFTDPPYNVDYRTDKHAAIANDDLGEGFGAFLLAACSAFLRHVKGGVYVCMSSSELGTLKAAFEAAGGHWSTYVIWAKNAFTLGRSDYQRQYEPILYGWPKGVDRFWCGARDQGDVWRHDRPAKNDLHPTMKPIALVEQAIRNSSKTRDLVLDPFGGSGTTLMAAEATGRTAALVELDPAYCDVIVRRWQDATGGVATLEGDERAFGEVACERLAGAAA